jgi:hypothetical protein
VKRTTLLFVAVVAILLVVGGVLLSVADAPVEGEPESKPRAAKSPTKRPPRPAPPKVVEPSPPPSPVETPPVADGHTASTPRAVLRFILDGLDPAIPPSDSTVEISLEADAGRPADDAVTCEANGGTAATFDVDVSPLLPEDATGTRLAVTLERAGYLPFVGRASIWLGRRGPKGPETGVVQVRLRPAGWARGVVQDERFAPVGNAFVGSFVREQNAWRRVDEVRADARGEYRVRLLPGAANLVVADADGKSPASIQATGVARDTTTLAPFTLRPGLAISGTVRRADGSPVFGARVVATPTWARTELRLGPHALAYPGGEVVECPAAASANEGLYSVSGLVPGDYDLTLAAPGVARDLLATLKRRAAPPLETLAFVVDGGTIVVDAVCDGRPVPRLPVTFLNESAPPESATTVVETDAKGAARVVVQPAIPYRVSIDVKAFDPEKRLVIAPPLGAETTIQVVLRRRLARPKLVLVLRPEDAEGADAVTAADVKLYADGETQSVLPDASETVAFEKGVASATAPWAGAFRVVVTPRGAGYRLPAVARAGAKDGGQTKVVLKFPRGGRLRLVVHDSSGNPVPAQFRVLGDAGEEIAAGTANADEPLLPAGRRRIEVTPPGAPARPVDVLIRADETTVLTLESTPPTKNR